MQRSKQKTNTMDLHEYEVTVSAREFQKFLVEAYDESEAEEKALDLFSNGFIGTPVDRYDAGVEVVDTRKVSG